MHVKSYHTGLSPGKREFGWAAQRTVNFPSIPWRHRLSLNGVAGNLSTAIPGRIALAYALADDIGFSPYPPLPPPG
jgi:hypothetical protein